MKRLSLVIALLIMIGMGGLPGNRSAFAYEEVDTSDGGTIVGKVVLKGDVPEPRIFPLVLYPFGPFCKRFQTARGTFVSKSSSSEKREAWETQSWPFKRSRKGSLLSRSRPTSWRSIVCFIPPMWRMTNSFRSW